MEATQCALFAAHTLHAEIRAATEKLFAPSSASDSDAGHLGLILDTDLILNFVLGGAMHGIAENLPASPFQAFQSFAATDAKDAAADTKEKRLESFIAHGVGKGLASLSYLIEGSNDALKSLSTKLNTFLPLGSSSIKGGENMQSESENPDAQAAGRCHNKGNGWRSIIVRLEEREGFFHLGPEGPGGAFEGIFIPRSGPVERVRGRCLENGIEIFRPKDTPVFRYEGTFEPDPELPGEERLHGTRTLLTNILDELKISQDQLSPAFVPDDWIADKGT